MHGYMYFFTVEEKSFVSFIKVERDKCIILRDWITK